METKREFHPVFCIDPSQNGNARKLLEMTAPDLCDHVLIEIFRNLDVDDLYRVAECNSRFRVFAQTAFVDGKANGKLTSSRLKERGVLIFAPFAKHFMDHASSSNIWPHLTLNKLESMDIYMPYSGRQLLQYMNGQRSDDAASFDALGKLELHGKCAYEGLSPFNFPLWFPNLKQLTVAHPDLWLYSDDELLPCNLHELSFTVHQQVIDYDRWFRRNPTLVKLELQCDGVPALEAMCTYGLHDTLQSLSILVCQKFDFYNEWMAFCRVLGKFEQLKSLSIEFRYCGMMIGFAEALIGMRKLESLRLKGCSDEPENEIQFLTSLAANAPPHLKLFEVEEALMCIYRSEWDEFVEAMPKTECLHAAPFREDFEHRH